MATITQVRTPTLVLHSEDDLRCPVEQGQRYFTALKQQGATAVAAYCSHGVLSGGAEARVAASELAELVVTDSIAAGDLEPSSGKLRRLPIAPLFAEAIRRIADESSVSSLFD